VLFDHDAKVSGNSAHFAEFLAAGGQQFWGILRAEGLGRLGYRSVMHPAGRGLGALLTSMRFSSDRAVLAPGCDFRTIRLRRSSACPRWSSNGNWTAGQKCPAGTGLRDPQAWRPATCCALAGSARSQKTDRTFMYKL